jgi:hypothetical protein
MAEGLLSIRAYARRRKVSHTAVEDAISTGRISRAIRSRAPSGRVKIDPALADAEWDANTHPGNARSGMGQAAPTSAPDDYRKTLTIERVVKTRRAQMLLERDQGKLVEIEDVRKTVFEMVRTLRNQLFQLPDTLCDEIALENDPARVRAILMREFKGLMEQLAKRAEKSTLQVLAPETNGTTPHA